MSNKVYKSESGENSIRILVSEIYDSYKDNEFSRLKINTSIGKTNVLQFGDTKKPVLLMLHGTMSNSATWFGSLNYFINDFCIG